MGHGPRLLALTMLLGCADPLPPEDPSDWYDAGSTAEIDESIEFTRQGYDFPADEAEGIGALLDEAFGFPDGQNFGTNVAASRFTEAYDECDRHFESEELPRVIEGIVTMRPRYYFKAGGCARNDNKYYGSFMLQDATGGVFVLGDAKFASFDTGDRVRIRVIGTRVSFDLPMVYSHELLSVERLGEPLYFEPATGPLGDGDVGFVRRVTGEVVAAPDNFGTFYIRPDAWENDCSATSLSGCVPASLDVELNRRGVTVDVGAQVRVTAPVIYSFSEYTLIVMRLGNLERLSD